MENIIYPAIALITGGLLSWFWNKISSDKKLQQFKESAQATLTTVEKELVGYKATAESQLASAVNNAKRFQDNIDSLIKTVDQKQNELENLQNASITTSANYQSARQTLTEKQNEINRQKDELIKVKKDSELMNRKLATTEAENNVLQHKLQTQKLEMEELNKKFTTEFENIANKILDTKSQKFTDLNKENLKNILDPLGKNIDDFKKQVEEVYRSESKERFSLGEKVKELALLNNIISEEARNLTRALKGEAKTQGRWGEVILENVLDKSGLRKGEEYFMEYQLFDADGKALRSEAEGKKMRPDALVMYPDNRHIIIDAKVSLNAFVRFVESDDPILQKAALETHIIAIKAHINELSKKAYDDYDKTLDFVMMFIPNEPAYITAMQGEPDLWNYAYERRILLISPTNLIAALKLMVDLWKREYQNQNAKAIAERGAKMYDKFVGFVENLEAVGVHLDRAQDKYREAFKQLNSGNDNLVAQSAKLKALGIKTKKDLPSGYSDLALQNEDDNE